MVVENVGVVNPNYPTVDVRVSMRIRGVGRVDNHNVGFWSFVANDVLLLPGVVCSVTCPECLVFIYSIVPELDEAPVRWCATRLNLVISSHLCP